MWRGIVVFLAFSSFGCYSKDVIDQISNSSVMVLTTNSSGSGSAFKNDNTTFIWTVGHVLDSSKEINKLFDLKSQQIITSVDFPDVVLRQNVFENGRKVGYTDRYGKVLRVSRIHDIALIKVYGNNWPNSSIELLEESNEPSRSQELWHVGNMYGGKSPNGLSKIIFSQSGLLRTGIETGDLNALAVPFDHYTGIAHPGSSGGGIFDSKGRLVSMVSQFAAKDSVGSFLAVPSKRIREFAKKYNCEWAVNKKIPYVEETGGIVWVDPIKIKEQEKDEE